MVTDVGEESNKVKNSQCKEDKFNCIFKYYEKAIEGRNFHYQNYNTWANYYSIFTGALFVGFYKITPSVLPHTSQEHSPSIRQLASSAQAE